MRMSINVEEIMEDKRTLRELSEKEVEHVCGGALTSANPGGQPHGASQITTNSGGNAPPGQNKDLPPGLQRLI
jgi:hypothetical protein